MHVAPPGVDPAPPRARQATARPCCASAPLTPTKGQDLLVEALADVGRPGLDLHAGRSAGRDPAHVAAVRDAVARHGLGDRVRLAGPLTGAALDAAYAAADLLVLPSRAETYGMVVTEALARGIPVLAATSAGCPRRSAAPRTAACPACWCRPVTPRRSPRPCAAG